MEEEQQTTSITIQTTDADGVESTQVLTVDPQQLAQAIAQSEDGTAQIVDGDGNIITLTTEHLTAAGLLQVENVDGIEGLQGLEQFTEGQLVTGEDGQTYYVISEEQAASMGLDEQSGIVLQGEGIPTGDGDQQHVGKMELSSQQQSYATGETSASTEAVTDGQKEPETDGNAAVIAALNLLSPEALANLGAPEEVKNLIDQMRKGMEEKDKKLEEMENKLKETTEQNIIMAHALVSTCKSQEVEVVVQNPDGTTGKRQVVSVKQGGLTTTTQPEPTLGGTFATPQAKSTPANRRYDQQNRQTPARTPGVRADYLPFQCPQCPKRFAAEHHLKRHVDMAHQKKRAFYCRFCARDLFFPSQEHFSAHLRLNHKRAIEMEGGSENSPVSTQPAAAAAGSKPTQSAAKESSDVAIVGTVEAATEAKMAAAQKAKTPLTADVEEIEMEPNWEELEKGAAAETPFRHRSDFHRCDQCGKVFSTSVSLFHHIKTTHGRKPDEADKAGSQDTVDFGNFICRYCERQFMSIAGFRRHCATVHPNEPSQLPPAVEAKESKAPLKEQQGESGSVVSAVENNAYSCPDCNKGFAKPDWLDKHRIAHTAATPYNCHLCPRKFKWKENLEQHQQWHQQSLPFKCQVCSKAFVSDSRLEAHTRLKHTVKPAAKEHTCLVCNRVFSERDSLARHMREHTDNIFPCTECDKKFIDEKFLRRHMVIHTQARDYTCEYCQKTFARAESLKAHRFVHTGVKSHKCETCHAAFYTAWNLKNHMQLHSKTKTHVCEHCGRSFADSLNLEVHLRIHRNQKPFQCSSCTKTFSRIEHLKTHIDAHNGILPHPCPQCDRAFSSAANLLQHIRIHSGEKPFQCGTCGKAFVNRKLLQSHLESHSRNTDVQYVVIWEKGGALQEAVIITDGVPQEATVAGDAANQPAASQTEAQLKADKHAAAPEVMEVDQPVQPATHYINAKTEAGGTLDISGMNIVDMNGVPISMEDAAALLSQAGGDQIQLIDEHGNPIEGLSGGEQYVIMQEDGNMQALDGAHIMAVQEGAEGEEPIYLSAEDLQALADQGVLVEYQ